VGGSGGMGEAEGGAGILPAGGGLGAGEWSRMGKGEIVDLGKGMGEMGWGCLFVLGILLVNLIMKTMRQGVQCFEKVHDIGLADFYALVGVHVLA